jgi:hypothetical protein
LSRNKFKGGLVARIFRQRNIPSPRHQAHFVQSSNVISIWEQPEEGPNLWFTATRVGCQKRPATGLAGSTS